MSTFKPFIASCIIFSLHVLQAMGQASLGDIDPTKLKLYEYYNHTSEEWIKLFRIKNYNAPGYWGRGGVSGRVYFCDYQGEGGSYVDFSFPQSISSQQKPLLILNGASSDDFDWHAYSGSDGPGLEYYDVYIKTPHYHLGFSFFIRGNDFDPYFHSATTPSGTPVWNYLNSPASFTHFSANGNVGYGMINPDSKLSVNGNIRAKEIKVEVNNWPDYVFYQNYKLPSLAFTRNYIRDKGHLPEIPSASEVEQGGINLGEMNARLLKKIEELTLHLLDQDNKMKHLESELKAVKAKVK